MKRLLTTVLALLPFFSIAQTAQQNNLVDYINPLMGTASKPIMSNGNTYPAVALPWGMNTWTAQTGKMGSGWQYTYDADKIRGFKQTHQPSPWMNDYGMFSILPETGRIRLDDLNLRKPTLDDVFLSLTGHVAEVPAEDEPDSSGRQAGSGDKSDKTDQTEKVAPL